MEIKPRTSGKPPQAIFIRTREKIQMKRKSFYQELTTEGIIWEFIWIDSINRRDKRGIYWFSLSSTKLMLFNKQYVTISEGFEVQENNLQSIGQGWWNDEAIQIFLIFVTIFVIDQYASCWQEPEEWEDHQNPHFISLDLCPSSKLDPRPAPAAAARSKTRNIWPAVSLSSSSGPGVPKMWWKKLSH